MYLTAFPDQRPTFIRHLLDGSTVVTEYRAEFLQQLGVMPAMEGASAG